MQILVYVRLSSADTRSPQLYHISIITAHVVIMRKRCRFNEKRSRYNEKICRFNEKRSRFNEKRCRFNEKRSRYNEKRSRYYDIIEWKKYYMDGSITSHRTHARAVLGCLSVSLSRSEALSPSNTVKLSSLPSVWSAV